MDGLRAIRGQGLLGLRRPYDLDPTDVWDWPELSGRWFVTAAWFGHREDNNLHLLPEPGFCALTATSRPDDILQAMTDVGLEKDQAASEWNKVARRLHLVPNSPLPPVYFHGVNESPVEDADSSILFGVVRLTTDSPPQLLWTVSMRTLGPKGRLSDGSERIFNGIQLGGRGAERGVMGVSLRRFSSHF